MTRVAEPAPRWDRSAWGGGWWEPWGGTGGELRCPAWRVVLLRGQCNHGVSPRMGTCAAMSPPACRGGAWCPCCPPSPRTDPPSPGTDIPAPGSDPPTPRDRAFNLWIRPSIPGDRASNPWISPSTPGTAPHPISLHSPSPAWAPLFTHGVKVVLPVPTLCVHICSRRRQSDLKPPQKKKAPGPGDFAP